MKIFTQHINEAGKFTGRGNNIDNEINQFINRVKNQIPRTVKDVIYLTQKYHLVDRESIDEIISANKPSLKSLASKYSMTHDQMIEFWQMAKSLKNNIYLLPQYMSEQEREEIEKGELAMSDLTIDLETSTGRNAVAKMYTPLLNVVVNQWLGKSKMSRGELMSSAKFALVNAMNDWDRSTGVPFKTYLGTRVRQQILNDINQYSHALSGTSWYTHAKGYNADASSLDTLLGWESEDHHDDSRLASLGVNDNTVTNNEREKLWKEVYDLLTLKFKQRDIDIFCRKYGWMGYKEEKNKDIARELGVSDAYITIICKKVITHIQKDQRIANVISEIQDSYNESLMYKHLSLSAEEFLEVLVNDDMYILLEELTRWSNKSVFRGALEQALVTLSKEDQKYIIDVLKNDFDFLDGSFKKHKKTIILFLSNMYITEPMNRKSDVALLEYMIEVQEAYQKHK